MMTIGRARIFLYGQGVDMRRGFEGLSALVENTFDGQLLSGAYFIFINRTRDRMKVLYWDSDGLAIWYKRLEKGSFSPLAKGHQQLSRREFIMLLEDLSPKRINRRYKHLDKSV